MRVTLTTLCLLVGVPCLLLCAVAVFLLSSETSEGDELAVLEEREGYQPLQGLQIVKLIYKISALLHSNVKYRRSGNFRS